jgi:hypothetical protein
VSIALKRTEIGPDEWLAGEELPPIELDSPYDLITNPDDRASIPERDRRRAVAHALASAIREARRHSVGTQIAAAEAWGRSQSQVSRLEADPSIVQLGTLLDYLASMNVAISFHLEIDGFHVDVEASPGLSAAA